MFNDKSILITGGTGSFGKQYVKTLSAEDMHNEVDVEGRRDYNYILLTKKAGNP